MVKVLQGNCLEVLRELPDESVQCVATSPPYWGLRDYGIPPVEWPEVEYVPMAGLDPITVSATTSVHGMEPTLGAFVAHEVAIFREVRRVLRRDGVCWVNMGDAYSQSFGGEQGKNGQMAGRSVASARIVRAPKCDDLPPKNLLGQPWRVAFALQADGWYLRQDIILYKRNPMPESVRDRCTKAHEYLFLLSKSERYYWDQDAVREPHTSGENTPEGLEARRAIGDPNGRVTGTKRDAVDGVLRTRAPSRPPGYIGHPNGRNPRSVWSISSEPLKEAHFAAFPTALPKRCILASSRPGDTVLDPFGGSGTTGMVASELGRRAILIEQNPEYIKIIKGRVNAVTPGLPLL